MTISHATSPASSLRRSLGRASVFLHCAACLALLFAAVRALPQTLARPGWAGSGMTVERWWPHAVLCEILPDSLGQLSGAATVPTLHRLSAHMEDLQTLGVDAVLLRGLEPGTQAAPGEGKSPSTISAVALDPRYGSLDDFDRLVTEAVRHGIRVLVELRQGAGGATTVADARFWLSRGVTGLALAKGDEGQTSSLRAVLHGYIGERILIAEGSGASATRADQPDLLVVRLPPLSEGTTAVRQSLQNVQVLLAAHTPVPLLTASDAGAPTASARPLATALLGSGGAVLLPADSLDLGDAASPSTTSTFAWFRQWTGLHRGNVVMRTGSDTLLDHDADGALVWVRQAGPAMPPIVGICNVTARPIHLSLVEDIAKLHLRGSFLRTLSRSDNGMGAMPLRAVTLPPYAVYVGELSR